jgi:hypothetical protein
LDNGILSCADPKRVQALCDGLSAEKVAGLLRKWFSKLPHPFTSQDRQAGYRYQISILQAGFPLTQVLDRSVTGRVFFEEVIRENLDIGRPDQVQLILIARRTPGKFRTRVITDGVVPSLPVDYKNSRIKQYHKEGRALRTETTLNNTGGFGIGKLLQNLEMRVLLAQLLGLDPAQYPVGRMTYDLRRLRLHGLIQRIPKSHRYERTPLRPKLAQIMPLAPPGDSPHRLSSAPD